MALVESLLTAIVRADGDALVMHVGEKPYVVASAGPIELSSQGLNLQAMAGMVAQLLPADAQRGLAEFGAVEHELASTPEMQGDRFTVVVARGGDDVWIELRRHRRPVQAAAAAPTAAAAPPSLAAEPSPAEAPVQAPDVIAVDTPAAAAHHQAVDAPVDITANEPAAPDAAGVVEAIAADGAEPIAPVPSVDLPADWCAATPAVVPSEVVAPETSIAAQSIVAVDDVHVTPGEPVVSAGAVEGEPATNLEPAALDAREAPAAQAPEAPSAPETVEAPEELETPEAPGLVAEPEPMFAAQAEATIAAMAEPVVPTAKPEPVATAAAAVIPMTRTLRIAVPPSPSSRATTPSDIKRLLSIASSRAATALYLTTDASPYMRVDADVRALEGEPPLSSADIESAVFELMPDALRDAWRRGEPSEWAAELPDVGHVRCSTFRDHRGPGAIFQLVSMRPVAAAQLGLSAEVQALATESDGLVLVSTPRANGKTTLVGSLVDLINRERGYYVITLERQIRVVHEHHHALISQREISGTSDQQLAVARSAVRESPDVLVIEDLSSAEMFELALEAAGGGLLVIASVTAASTAAALARLFDLCPADKRAAMQSLVAERLRGAVAQVLLRRTRGGRVAAREVVLATAGVARVVGAGQLHDLRSAIEGGRKHGMVSLTEALVQLVRSGAIELREAYRKTDDREALVAALKSENVDTSFVERLA